MSSVAEDKLNKLSEVVFEVIQGREPKLLLCVCDDLREMRKLRTRLHREIERNEKSVSVIRIRKGNPNLLQRFYAESRTGEVDAIVVWGLHLLSSNTLDAALKELNFHRDALVALKLPIIFWLTTPLLLRLAALAPDVWSRRTAIYRFSTQPPAALLSRLFENEVTPRTQNPIHRALESILKREEALGKCIRRKSFSLQEADDHIRAIHSDLSAVEHACQQSKQIDVALWFWNLTAVDAFLQRVVEALPDANLFESLYTDRNESLLHAAQLMPRLLQDYKTQVEERIKVKRRPHLVSLFQKLVMEKLTKTIDELQQNVGVSIESVEPWLIDDGRDFRDSFVPTETLGNRFGAIASYDLESWLSGYNVNRPSIFSETEGRLLRALYGQTPRDELRQTFKLSEATLRQEIRRLEHKVRFFLDVGPEEPRLLAKPKR